MSTERRLLRRWSAPLFLGGLFLVVLNLGLARVFSLDPLALDKMLLRIAADRVFQVAYREDLRYVESKKRGYLKGTPAEGDPEAQWQSLAATGAVSRPLYRGASALPEPVPFVYQEPESPYLASLRQRYPLESLAAAEKDEYLAMLRVFGWLGSRFDHGADQVPGGTKRLDPEKVLEGGARGGKYWCEIAAKLSVEVASALGWPARLTTASRDGYSWDHAVAEVWSNRFNKWFALDTDFNVIYESGGVPLSAFELCHRGEDLARAGKLQLRFIAPAKPSLKRIDLLPFYRYVHIDLRNDWFTRTLRPMSPAAGDVSTWWTARGDLGPILTAKQRVDEQGLFDWRLNQVVIAPLRVERGEGGGGRLALALSSYAPAFDFFELRHNEKRYQSRDGKAVLELAGGENVIAARTVSRRGALGPWYRVSFRFPGKSKVEGNPAAPRRVP